MDLDAIHFDQHSSCEALTASIASLPGSQRREKCLTFQENEFLWLAADPPLHVYYLESGRVEITETDRRGRATLVRIVEPGQMFGYLCFCPYRFEPRGTEARATTASVVLRTGYQDFRSAMKRNSATANRLMEDLCLRVVDAERRASILTIHDAKKRLATLLHQLATIQTEKIDNRKAKVLLYTSHAELAALASLTRPHTTVLMNRLRALGCVSYERGTAIQVNLQRLKHYL